MGHLAATGQVLADGHLEEVEGCVQAVLVQLQLVPQVVDVPPAYDTKQEVTSAPLASHDTAREVTAEPTARGCLAI